MLLGFAAMFTAYRLEPDTLKKIALPLLIFSLLLLVLVFVPGMGISAGGAKKMVKTLALNLSAIRTGQAFNGDIPC